MYHCKKCAGCGGTSIETHSNLNVDSHHQQHACLMSLMARTFTKVKVNQSRLSNLCSMFTCVFVATLTWFGLNRVRLCTHTMFHQGSEHVLAHVSGHMFMRKNATSSNTCTGAPFWASWELNASETSMFMEATVIVRSPTQKAKQADEKRSTVLGCLGSACDRVGPGGTCIPPPCENGIRSSEKGSQRALRGLKRAQKSTELRITVA